MYVYSIADCKVQKKSAELTKHSRRYSQYLKSRKVSLHPYHNTYVYKHRCRQLTLVILNSLKLAVLLLSSVKCLNDECSMSPEHGTNIIKISDIRKCD